MSCGDGEGAGRVELGDWVSWTLGHVRKEEVNERWLNREDGNGPIGSWKMEAGRQLRCEAGT